MEARRSVTQPDDEFEPSVTLKTRARPPSAIMAFEDGELSEEDSVRLFQALAEHKALRDAVDAASVQGTVTWLRNSAGAPVAAIVPYGYVLDVRRRCPS